MKKYIILLLLLLLPAIVHAVTATGTGLTIKGGDVIAVVSYEDDAARLASIRDQLAAYCSAHPCEKLRASYNDTRDLFVWFGDKLELYIYRRDARSADGYNNIKTRYETSRQALFDAVKNAGMEVPK